MLQLKCGAAFNKSIGASNQWIEVTTEFKGFVECFKNELKTDFQALKGGTIVDDLGRPILVMARKSEGFLWLKLVAGAKSDPKSGPLIEVERSYPISEIGIMDNDTE